MEEDSPIVRAEASVVIGAAWLEEGAGEALSVERIHGGDPVWGGVEEE